MTVTRLHALIHNVIIVYKQVSLEVAAADVAPGYASEACLATFLRCTSFFSTLCTVLHMLNTRDDRNCAMRSVGHVQVQWER